MEIEKWFMGFVERETLSKSRRSKVGEPKEVLRSSRSIGRPGTRHAASCNGAESDRSFGKSVFSIFSSPGQLHPSRSSSRSGWSRRMAGKPSECQRLSLFSDILATARLMGSSNGSDVHEEQSVKLRSTMLFAFAKMTAALLKLSVSLIGGVPGVADGGCCHFLNLSKNFCFWGGGRTDGRRGPLYVVMKGSKSWRSARVRNRPWLLWYLQGETGVIWR